MSTILGSLEHVLLANLMFLQKKETRQLNFIFSVMTPHGQKISIAGSFETFEYLPFVRLK